MSPMDSQATVKQAEIRTRSSYVVKIEAPSVDVHRSASQDSARQGQVMRGQTYEVLGRTQQGWVRIRTGGREGYIKTSGNATVVEKAHETVDEDAKMRRQVVEYALQFVGGRYQYGGVDPNKGVDCSGFTRYVLGKAASINLPHSSTGQSSYGKAVTEDQMQPGDLLFYAGEHRLLPAAALSDELQLCFHAAFEGNWQVKGLRRERRRHHLRNRDLQRARPRRIPPWLPFTGW